MSESGGTRTGVVTLSFGEPERATEEEVVPFLERIFYRNASLEEHATEEERRRRSRELARRRAPGLLEEYREIGGSPLNGQAREQADALERELRSRGLDATVYVAMQFTEPFIPDVVDRARADGMERLVGLPVYPLCGPSTTVAALEDLVAAVDRSGWDVEVDEFTGWHRHPDYVELRADNVRSFTAKRDLELDDPDTLLVFSAHGTPIRYLESGNRYEAYVEDLCRSLLDALNVERFALGYQNHGNRRIPWTEPEIEEVVERVTADRIVVEPVSFMHEQSETLAELDVELREAVEARGIEFHRVPVPHRSDRFVALLADLVEAVTGGRADPPEGAVTRCLCRRSSRTYCLNAAAGLKSLEGVGS